MLTARSSTAAATSRLAPAAGALLHENGRAKQHVGQNCAGGHRHLQGGRDRVGDVSRASRQVGRRQLGRRRGRHTQLMAPPCSALHSLVAQIATRLTRWLLSLELTAAWKASSFSPFSSCATTGAGGEAVAVASRRLLQAAVLHRWKSTNIMAAFRGNQAATHLGAERHDVHRHVILLQLLGNLDQ